MNIFDVLPYFHEAPWSYIVVPIMLVTSIIGFYHKPFFYALLLHPYEIYRGRRLHTLLTSAFVHRNWLHLTINALLIYGFGYDMFGNIEQENNRLTAYLLTPILFVILIVLPNLIQTYVKRNDFLFTAAGSSGLTFGLYGFSFLYFPLQKIQSYWLSFVQISFHYWICTLLVIVLLTTVKSTMTNKHLHLSAFVIGSIIAVLVRFESIVEIVSTFH